MDPGRSTNIHSYVKPGGPHAGTPETPGQIFIDLCASLRARAVGNGPGSDCGRFFYKIGQHRNPAQKYRC